MLALVVSAVVLGGIVAGVALALLINRGSDEGDAVLTSPISAAATSTSTSPPPPPTSSAPTPAAPTTQAARPGQLHSTYATLRSGPTLHDSTEITIIEDREDDPLTIVEGPNPDGWYLVEMDGMQGWIFGAFVLPPAANHHAGETLDGSRAVLRSESGEPLGLENPSGNAVLVVGSTGEPYWKVQLPDGTTAWVAGSEMRVVQ